MEKVFLSLLALVVAAGCGQASAEGGHSPEHVAKILTESVQEYRFDDAVNVIVPEDRGLLVLGLVFVGGFMTLGDKDAAAEYEEMIEGFGVHKDGIRDAIGNMKDPEKARPAAEAALEGVDREKLAAKVGAFMKRHAKDGKNPMKMGGKLTELSIDGDNATGRLGSKPIAFRRIDGRWYASVPMK